MPDERLSAELLRRLDLPTGAPILREELVAAAFTDADLRNLRRTELLERIFRGAYGTPTGSIHADARYLVTVRAFADPRRHRADQPVIAGPASVVLHGLPLLGKPPRYVHVARAYTGGRSARGLAIPVGAVPSSQRTTVDGLASVCAARAALDTARLMSLEAGVAAADAALARGLATAPELVAVAAGMAGTRGAARARRCAELADARSESPGESWSAVVLDRLGIVRPDRQHAVFDTAGRIGRVDFWWPEHATVGEFDGRIKYGRANPAGRAPEDVLWAEKVREDRIRATGLAVVRWTTQDLVTPRTLARRLTAALTR